jgi:hypothetical protein
MAVHLLLLKILTYEPHKAKIFYGMVFAYCYVFNFIMLVTKDVLRHLLVTKSENGEEKVDTKTIGEFKLSLCLVMGCFVILALPL